MAWNGMLSGQMPNKTEFDHFIEIDDVNLHYRHYPAKKKKSPHIVLLHGFASSTYTWEKIDRRLNDEGFHIWALDMKGFGWSDKPRDSSYDAISLAEQVNRWMEALDIEQAIFVGNSYGGGVAAMLAFSYPKRISKVIAIDPATGQRMKLPFILRLLRFPFARDIGKLIYAKWMIRLVFREVYYHREWITEEQIEEYYQRINTANAIEAQVSLAKQINFDLYKAYTTRLHELTQPALLVWGANDKWIPTQLGIDLCATLPRARMVIIPECGHVPQEEKPDLTFRLIMDFIRGKDPLKIYDGAIAGNV
ncbi:MAG TPA: alpha/beta hydrolase, partial [Spirochaetota bacterium]|nr:alpha/beta hydrolase [Spirochaetota bacterium]